MQSLVIPLGWVDRVRPIAGRVLLEVPRKEIHYEETDFPKVRTEEINANPSKYRLFVTAKGGPIILPETARDHRITDTHQPARVLRVGYGQFWEDGQLYPGVNQDDFVPGDWVIFRPLLLELNVPYILTDVRRIDGRIEGHDSR
jgi:hypothetical protein